MLPILHTDDKDFSMMQTQWAQQLNPLIANPILNGIFLNSVFLVTGDNIINHKLSRQQQGWFITDINSPVTIYRSAAFNSKTLTLTSSGSAQVNLWVY